MADPPKIRKKRDTSKKHQVILENAINVFTRKGYETASMDEIAETAGVSKKTIYNHFESKEKLFQEIVAEFIKGRDSIKPVTYSQEILPEEQLKSFARAEIYLIDDPKRRGISRLLTSVFLVDQKFGRETRGQHRPYQNLIQWLKEAEKDGKIHFSSAQSAAGIFYGLIEGCITWKALMSDGATLNEVDEILNEIIAVFLSRYGGPADRQKMSS